MPQWHIGVFIIQKEKQSLTKQWSEADCLSRIVLTHAPRQATVSLTFDVSRQMIHGFPGMGADSRMYPSPWNTLPSFIAHDWPSYESEISIADVARKIADKHLIRDGDSLVGSSLGGIVACEIAKIRRITTLFLIGSAVRKTEVSSFLSILRPLVDIAPIKWIQFSAGKIPSDLTQMFSDVDDLFIRAMCHAIFDWEGFDSSNTKIFRIHGLHDYIIPSPKHADLLFDGGHLLSMTHAKECVAAIMRYQNENHEG